MMVEQVLHHIHNYFEKDTFKGKYSIIDGTLDVDFIKNGQYFRISGSSLNDGIYQYPADLVDEDFEGVITTLAVPRDVINLASEIQAWSNKNASTLGYTSESFGGYTYSRGVNGVNGAPIGWQDVFRDRLNAWRKLS